MTKALPPKNLILYADDDEDDIEFVKDAFKYYPNVELLTFPNGEPLLKHAENLRSEGVLPCLIILDINMPRLNGKEILIRLRNMEAYRNIPVILFSTSTLPSEAAFANSLNAGFITKPLDAKQLMVIADIFIDHCHDEIKRRIKKQGKKG